MTTRELTPEQTDEALLILRLLVAQSMDSETILDKFIWYTCSECRGGAATWKEIKHTPQCVVAKAAALLAAVDSAQEADE